MPSTERNTTLVVEAGTARTNRKSLGNVNLIMKTQKTSGKRNVPRLPLAIQFFGSGRIQFDCSLSRIILPVMVGVSESERAFAGVGQAAASEVYEKNTSPDLLLR
jgi:hypothetical protein